MATIKDIAEAAGVSIGTVDRIIHNRGRFSSETAEKVRSVMARLNYTPNIHARGLKKSGEKTFCAVLPDDQQDSGYWKLVTGGISRAIEELAPFSVKLEISQFDRYSEESIRNSFMDVLRMKPDGLMIAPVMPLVFREILGSLKVPYVFIDTDIPDDTAKIAYIGQDSFLSGMLSGRLMGMLLSSDASDILVIDPPGDNFHLQSRIAGFTNYMKKNRSDITISSIKIDSDEENAFHSELSRRIGKNGIPGGFYAANSSVYYLASWLERAGREYCEKPVIGYDLIPGLEKYVDSGVIDFILTQQPELQAYTGMITLYDSLILKKKTASEIIVPLNIITKENLRTFSSFKAVTGGIQI